MRRLRQSKVKFIFSLFVFIVLRVVISVVVAMVTSC